MSASLVWKSLQLFDAESTKKAGGSKSISKKGNKNFRNLIPTKRHGVQKELKRAKKEDRKLRSTLLGDKDALLPSLRRSGPNKLNQNEDKTEENLRKLKSLSAEPALDLATTEKLLNRATGRKVILIKEKEDTSTVFTEADFAKFAKNYATD